MKKTNFLKGLAMAAVALVSVFTPSCSEEELSIKGAEPVKPAPAVVQLAINVVDLDNSKTLAQKMEDVTTKMGTTYSVACPDFAGKDQYTTTENINVQVPTISEGQAVVIPVTFYVVHLNSALKDAMENAAPVKDNSVAPKVEEPEATATGSLPIENNVITNEGDENVTVQVSIPYVSGYEYRTSSKSIADDFQNLKFTNLIWKQDVIVPAGHMVEIVATQEIVPVILKVVVGEEGVEVPLWEAKELVVKTPATSIGHGHDHDHGHGNGNAGGGECQPA